MLSATAPAQPDHPLSPYRLPARQGIGLWRGPWHDRLAASPAWRLPLYRLASPGRVTFQRTKDGNWSFALTGWAPATSCRRRSARGRHGHRTIR